MEEKKLAEQLSQKSAPRDGGFGIDYKPPLPEAGGVAWTDVYHADGWKISLTSRATTPLLAFNELVEAIATIANQPITNEFHPIHIRSVRSDVNRNADVNRDAYADDGVPGALSQEDQDFVDTFNYGDIEEQVYDDIPETEEFPILKYPPKAAERQPSMKFAVKAWEYKYDGEYIRFYADGEYPLLSHNMKADYPKEQFKAIFSGWQPVMGERRNMTPIYLHAQCSADDARNSKGNLFVNLVGIDKA